ncbi:MAG: hypothetical protein QOC84_1287 [Bradyrhizobium sp.]|jgi:hypothetical protein|nr:hypothetical protein [Bradyrhizobium sp.]
MTMVRDKAAAPHPRWSRSSAEAVDASGICKTVIRVSLTDLGDFRIIRAGPRHVADTFAEQ